MLLLIKELYDVKNNCNKDYWQYGSKKSHHYGRSYMNQKSSHMSNLY